MKEQKKISLKNISDYEKQSDYIGQDILLEEARVPLATKSMILLSCFTLIAFFAWISFSTVNELVSGNGIIESTRNIITIQHNKSGILNALYVMEGQYVEEGELLYTLVDDKTKKKDNTHYIRSNTRGIIRSVMIEAIGQRISTRQSIMRLEPIADSVTASIEITPDDINSIQDGMPVQLKFKVGNRYETILGEITSISSNTFYSNNGKAYYQAKALLFKNHLGRDPNKNLILPGVKTRADIFITERSILSYLTKPLESSLNYALTER
ncbi:HlyD family efflux transporter periplasmic adaptor subunit [Halobacteriovorax sp. RT-1-4]|uniref:HlyD family efflux transporter periplasmic adaptor subunit n=1 Tax=unclassified Halobacteriovorax TaxID=2639665 RepID=UPI003999B723